MAYSSRKPTSKRRFIRLAPPASHRSGQPNDPGITIDRRRLYDLLDSLESFSGE